MSRSWQQNSDSINGLWPHCQWTDEEIDLWRSDLAGLDQDVLFEAIREVKRSRDTLYPQLAWVHAAYRTLMAAKRTEERKAAVREPEFAGERLEIDTDESRRIAAAITKDIESACNDDVDRILARINDNIDRLDASVAARLAWRAGALRRQRVSAGRHVAIYRPSDEPDEAFEQKRAEMLRKLKVAT